MSKEIKLEVEKKDGGYYFPQFDIHAIAKTEAEAKEIIKVGHGIDVDARIAELNKQPEETKDDGQPPTNDTEVE